MKNVSGDTVIGKSAVTSNYTINYVWYLSVTKSKTSEVCFAFADGSNSFLNVSSHSGSIDVYVGDGGSADLHSQEGKNIVLKKIYIYCVF